MLNNGLLINLKINKMENQDEKTLEFSATNLPLKIFNRQFKIDWDHVQSLDDLIVVLKAMDITIHWHSKECPERFKEIYDKGFLIETKQ
jgi:sporulation protein YlmC with PRC-barrel domain